MYRENIVSLMFTLYFFLVLCIFYIYHSNWRQFSDKTLCARIYFSHNNILPNSCKAQEECYVFNAYICLSDLLLHCNYCGCEGILINGTSLDILDANLVFEVGFFVLFIIHFFSFSLYPAYSRVGKSKLMLRHFTTFRPNFVFNSELTSRTSRHVTLSSYQSKKNNKIIHNLVWESNSQPIHNKTLCQNITYLLLSSFNIQRF